MLPLRATFPSWEEEQQEAPSVLCHTFVAVVFAHSSRLWSRSALGWRSVPWAARSSCGTAALPSGAFGAGMQWCSASLLCAVHTRECLLYSPKLRKLFYVSIWGH